MSPVRSPVRLHQATGCRILLHPAFGTASRSSHAFSVRQADGSHPTPGSVVRAGGFGQRRVAALRQVHGSEVVVRAVSDLSEGDIAAPEADGQVTRDPGIVLSIGSADCVPILAADPDSGTVGTAHAGWRGTVAGVARELVETMKDRLGCRQERIVTLLGPSIGACCYQVREDVAAAFRDAFPADAGFLRSDASSKESWRLDLAAANVAALRRAGIQDERIFVVELCTSCRQDLFPSYRIEGSAAGRLTSLIAPPD